MSHSLLLIDEAVINLSIFKLTATCPYLTITPFTDTTTVDTFFTNNTSTLAATTLSNIGCLNIFKSKSVLDHFDQQLTLLYPTISHIDILDINSTALQHNDVIKDLALTGTDQDLHLAEHDNNKKINFNTFDKQTYFSTPLRTLFHYVPLVFPATKSNCTNVMLIDSTISEAQMFYDAANNTTLPVLFNSDTLRSEIIQLLTNNTTINRLCVVATNRSMYNNTKLFINNEKYFTETDVVSSATYSNNVQFMIDLIKKHNIKTIDFLACESLKYTAWQNYYTLLQGQGCTIGASSDKTGNLAYDGNWIMESNGQNIQPVYFTTEIANYTLTLDTIVMNIVFDPTSTFEPYISNSYYNYYNYCTGNDYHIINSDKERNVTYAIWNTTSNPVTVYLADTTELLTYNVEINVVPTGNGNGNGSFVTIDGTGASIVPSSTLFNTTSLVKVVDTSTYSLTSISIKNINVDVSAHPVLSSTATVSNTGWILKGGLLNASTIFVDNCHVHSSGTLTISSSTGHTNGGIAGGANSNDSILTFTSCSVYSSGILIITANMNPYLYSGYNGGIVGGNNDGSSLIFNTCTVYSTNGDLTINDGYNNRFTGGIAGGDNDGSSLIFNTCTVYSTNGTLTINGGASSYYTGGIVGGANSMNSNIGSTLIFTSCSVYSTDGDLTINDGVDNLCAGVIAGGSNIRSSLTFTSCTVYSTDGDLTINDGYNNRLTGGIVGGENISSSLIFNTCSVYSSGTLTINGDNTGGIAGGYNFGGSLTFTSCSVYSSGTLTINGENTGGIAGGYNFGGIVGGYNFGGSRLIFNTCSVYSTDGDLTINGDNTGGIAGGDNDDSSLTFTSCSVYSSGTLTINGDNTGGIAGGDNNDNSSVTFTSCSIISTISVVGNVYTYVGHVLGLITSSETNNGFFICGLSSTNALYPTPSLLILATKAQYSYIFPLASVDNMNNTFKGHNLSAMDLTNVNFSNYNLDNTILFNAKLPYNENNYNNTIITDSVAITRNIVKNNAQAVVINNSKLTYTIIQMNNGGMKALINGFNHFFADDDVIYDRYFQNIISTFVANLYTAALNQYKTQINAIFVPVLTLPSVEPWLNPIAADSMVQLINSSHSVHSKYSVPTTSVDLSTLSFAVAHYYYILVKNSPDNVRITNGNNTLWFISNTNSTFSYAVNNGASVPSGDTFNFDKYTFHVGSSSLVFTINPEVTNICFPAGTPITTDQGDIPIEKLIPDFHTIGKKLIVDITKTVSPDNFLVCFKKHALGLNYPSKKTIMSKGHKLYFQGQMCEAYTFIGQFKNVKKIKYTGEILYNVLLEEHSLMKVNNLICETLHPDNIIAKLFTKKCKFTNAERDNIIVVLAECIKSKNYKMYNSILQIC